MTRVFNTIVPILIVTSRGTEGPGEMGRDVKSSTRCTRLVTQRTGDRRPNETGCSHVRNDPLTSHPSLPSVSKEFERETDGPMVSRRHRGMTSSGKDRPPGVVKDSP